MRVIVWTMAIVLAAGGGQAGPLALTMPAPAVEIGNRVENPGSFRLLTGPFGDGIIPGETATGGLDQRAFRLNGLKLNTLQMMLALRQQVTDAGFAVVYECDTAACGGFDFRFALDVLPEPQMHVDLGDFRYLAATKAGGVVSILVSRSADQGFVQVTSVDEAAVATMATAPGVATAPPPIAADPPVVDAPVVDAPVAEAPVVVASGSLAAKLLAQGSVALDDLIFPSGASALEDKDYASLTELAAWLAADPARKVVLVGHTDASGGLASNTALSKQRAQSVRSWLISHYGAQAGQIDAQGAGYLAPRDTNLTDAGRTRNRRVEVVLTSTP